MQKQLHLEAVCLLRLARLFLLFVPFKQLAPQLGSYMKEVYKAQSNQHHKLIMHSSSAVSTMSRFTPWQSKCFAQAITARWMLRKRGIGGTLYLGVAKKEDNYLKAHAWFKCGDIFVTGKKGHKEYTVVSFFSNPAN